MKNLGRLPFNLWLVIGAIFIFVPTAGTVFGQTEINTVFNTFDPNDGYSGTWLDIWFKTHPLAIDGDIGVPFIVENNSFMLKSVEMALRRNADGDPHGPGVGVYLGLTGNKFVGYDQPDFSNILEVFLFDSSEITTAGSILKAQSNLRPILEKGEKYWLVASIKECPDCRFYPSPTGWEYWGEVGWFVNSINCSGDLLLGNFNYWSFYAGRLLPACRVTGIPDTVPWAYAGYDQSVYCSSTVKLDGSKSTFGSGATLSYNWTFESKPVGSSAEFDNPASALPTFVPDVPGEYVVKLIVNDGYSDSEPDIVVIKAQNSPPVADAGDGQMVKVGTVVNLNGTGSYDPDGNYPLTYEWRWLKKPEGSAATLLGADTATPSFLKDRPEDYWIQLKVKDSLGLVGLDSVVISTFNTKPVADAGPDMVIKDVNEIVILDGTKSYDLDGDALTYTWTVVSRPTGSMTEPSDPQSPTTVFRLDVRGEYMIQLIVGDWSSMDIDYVMVSFANTPPVADAGGNQSVHIGETVLLDGSGSYDANRDTLSYSWFFVSKPEGSYAVLGGADRRISQFKADVAGTFIVSLVVCDGIEKSRPDNAEILCLTIQDSVSEDLAETNEVINAIDPVALLNPALANSLTNKINAALIMMEEGKYAEALDKLENDILKKTDGCAAEGRPDKNDWIKDCAEQAKVYPRILQAIELLRTLIE